MNIISPIDFVKISSPYHMKIKDVLNLPIGKPVCIFFLDRNMFDLSCDVKYNKINVPTKPSHFFKNGYYIEFTRRLGIFGTWKWTYDNHIDEGREFDIKLSNGIWYPLNSGHILKQKETFFDIPKKFINKHYTKLPVNTYIGWRGPMMLAENMDKCPNIVLKKDGSIN